MDRMREPAHRLAKLMLSSAIMLPATDLVLGKANQAVLRTLLVTLVVIGVYVGSSSTPTRADGTPPQYQAVNIQLPGWPYVTFGYGGSLCCGGNEINNQGVVVGTAYMDPSSAGCGTKHAWVFFSATGKYVDLGASVPHPLVSGSWATGISSASNKVAVRVRNCSAGTHSIMAASLTGNSVAWSKPCACSGYIAVGISREGIGIQGRGRHPALLSWTHGKPVVSRLPKDRGIMFTAGSPGGFVGMDYFEDPEVWLGNRAYILPHPNIGDYNYADAAVERKTPNGLEIDVDGALNNGDTGAFWVGHQKGTGNEFTFSFIKGSSYFPAAYSNLGISPDASIFWGYDQGEAAVWYAALGKNQSAVHSIDNLMANFVSSSTCTWWTSSSKSHVVGVDGKGDILVADGSHSCLLEPTHA